MFSPYKSLWGAAAVGSDAVMGTALWWDARELWSQSNGSDVIPRRARPDTEPGSFWLSWPEASRGGGGDAVERSSGARLDIVGRNWTRLGGLGLRRISYNAIIEQFQEVKSLTKSST